VTSEGVNAVLLNIRSQPDASTVEVAAGVDKELDALRTILPRDMKLAPFYDQSILVRESARSVWECIVFGLMLSIGIMVAFLKDVRLAAVAVLVIPLTVLITIARDEATSLELQPDDARGGSRRPSASSSMMRSW